MDHAKLQKMAGAVRTGGKGSVRRLVAFLSIESSKCVRRVSCLLLDLFNKKS